MTSLNIVFLENKMNQLSRNKKIQKLVGTLRNTDINIKQTSINSSMTFKIKFLHIFMIDNKNEVFS
jgi:hypothetical protein